MSTNGSKWNDAETARLVSIMAAGGSSQDALREMPGRTLFGIEAKMRHLRLMATIAATAPAAVEAPIPAPAPAPVLPSLPPRVRRIEPLFDVVPPAARNAVRIKPGTDCRPGSVLAGLVLPTRADLRTPRRG